MAVTQYIGSRYVPIFADPAEWSSAKEYEPLTIVLHDGNSFTSKQFVPVGIDITNESYWAETGNFNAQVEQYRDEVRSFDARITENASHISDLQGDLNELADVLPQDSFAGTTVKGYVDEHIGTETQDRITAIQSLRNDVLHVCDVTKYGAVSGSMDNDWQTIFNSCLTAGRCIYFPAGVWNIQDAYDIVNPLQIVADAPLNFVSQGSRFNILVAYTSRACLISGVVFNGQGVAETALYFNDTSTNAACIIGCSFIDFTGSAINSLALGLFVEGCIFHDNVVRNDETLVPRMVGIHGTTDNFIIGCKFFHQLCAIRINSGIIDSCYMYSAPHNNIARASYGIMPIGLTMSVVVTHCEFDTITYCLGICNRSIIENCRFLWDAGINEISSIFYLDGATNATIREISFDKNLIVGAPSDVSLQHEIRMFHCSNNVTGCNLDTYSSEKCIYRDRGGANETVKLFVGLKDNGGALDSNTNWQHYEVAYPILDNRPISARISGGNNAFGFKFLVFGSSTSQVSSHGASSLHPRVKGNATAAYLHNVSDDGFYLKGSGTQTLNAIENYTGRALWHELGTSVTELPEGATTVTCD